MAPKRKNDENTLQLYNSIEEVDGEKSCVLCGQSEDDPKEFGKLLAVDDITVHHFCALLSSNLHGIESDAIKKEVKRASKLFCAYCKKSGASIGCWVRSCRKSFHFPCAIKFDCAYEFNVEYRSYCNVHFDSYTLNTVETHEPEEICGICTLSMGPFNAMQSLKVPCCSNKTWYHKSCLKQMAFGLTDDFECVSCDNRDDFRHNMRANGIFIPDIGYLQEENTAEPEPKQKKRRVHKIYTLENTFQSKSEAVAAVESERIWSYYYENNSTAGVRVNYRCNLMKFRGQQCAAGLYLLYDSRSSAIHLYRAESAHTHDDDANKENAVDRISGALEDEIRALYLLNVKPKAILYTLVRKGFTPPPKSKLTTFLNKIRKETFGTARLDYGALEKWLQENSAIPEDHNKAFIVSYEVHTDENDYENCKFRFFASTKLLLRQAERAKAVHTDATYKIVWQGFPVFQIGTTDLNRKYHPFGLAVCSHERGEDFGFIFRTLKSGVKEVTGQEIRPEVLVCDAADSIHNGFKSEFPELSQQIIVCWAHVRRAVAKKLPTYIKDSKLQAEFMADLDKLQLSQSNDIFDAAAQLFLLKWKKHSIDLVKYFKKEWIIDHKNWHEGFKQKKPSQNNALEASNKYIKDEHTFRERFDLSQFRTVLFNIVEQWSIEYDTGLNKIEYDKPNVKLETWTKGYNFARSNVNVTSERTEDKIVYSIPMTPDAVDNSGSFETWTTFAQFKHEAFAFVHTSYDYPVTAENWIHGECDCRDGFKLFVCEHLVGVALRLKVVSAPAEAKSIPIGQKRKPGRPSKAKSALQRQ